MPVQAASSEYEICKKMAHTRLLKSKPPKIIVTSVPSKQEIIKDKEESEPSNSWAITAASSNMEKQPVKVRMLVTTIITD